MTWGSVESSTRGTDGLGAEAPGDLVHVDGAVVADVVDAHVEHVGALRTWSLAIWTRVSQSSASMASRNFLEPLALVRSPMIRNEVSWSKGVSE